MLLHRASIALAIVGATGLALVGCTNTSTTVIDSRTGRPIKNARIEQNGGPTIYTDAQGNAVRKGSTSATVRREGYSDVRVSQ